MAVQPKQNDDIALYEYQLPAVSAKEQHHNEHIYDCYREKPLPPQSIILLIFLMLGLIVKLFLADLQPSANSPVMSCDENISNFNAVNDLNMSDSAQNCPPGFKVYQSGGVRACGRLASNNAGCVSNKFPSNGVAYSEVCGRVVGYQYGTPDAVSNDNSLQNHNISGADYVDGVSITYGSSYNHIWTLMAGWTDTQTDNTNTCPCSDYLPSNTNQNLQSFIGNNYFCESGSSNAHAQFTLFTSDPLWDGKGCGPNEDRCCSAPGLPWFYRDFGNNTYITDYIELKVCGDESTQNEDVPVSYYEIYVK